jgi:hypothetical protein
MFLAYNGLHHPFPGCLACLNPCASPDRGFLNLQFFKLQIYAVRFDSQLNDLALALFFAPLFALLAPLGLSSPWMLL